MMGFGALKYPNSSRTHLPIHSLLCPASPSLQTSGQGLCVSGAGRGPLSVPEPCPISDSLCKQQQAQCYTLGVQEKAG